MSRTCTISGSALLINMKISIVVCVLMCVCAYVIATGKEEGGAGGTPPSIIHALPPPDDLIIRLRREVNSRDPAALRRAQHSSDLDRGKFVRSRRPTKMQTHSLD